MIERLEGTGWRVYETKPELFIVDNGPKPEGAAYVMVLKYPNGNVGVMTFCADLPPAVALVLAAKLAEFAGGAK